MYILNLVLFILIVFILLILFIPITINFYINSEDTRDSHIDFCWLYPFYKSTLCMNSKGFFINTYIFRKNINIKKIQVKNMHSNYPVKDKVSILKGIHLDYIYLDTHYGFSDPLFTGIICGFINLIPEHSGVNEIYNNPEFMVNDSYFSAKGTVKLNIFYAIIKILKFYIKNYNNKLSYGHN